jgi:hypothetical protein
MSKIEDGGPAFPCAEHGIHQAENGMSLRDWFAGMALQGMLAFPEDEATSESFAQITKRFSEGAYVYADAMLAARKAKP